MSECGSTRTLLGSDEGETTDQVILLHGPAKLRDGKSWKERHCVLSKLSPAADCLQLQIYRDEKEKLRNGQTKASLSLQHFLALETGFTLDKESHTLCLLCQDVCVVLAFSSRERLLQWTVRIANNLDEAQQFLAQLAVAPPKSRLKPGPVRIHVREGSFCLTAGVPPRLLATFHTKDLRRYGLLDGKFLFEGGSRCGRGEGLHVLIPDPQNAQALIQTLQGASNTNTRLLTGAEVESPRKSLCKPPEDLCLSEEALWKSGGRSIEESVCSSPTGQPQVASLERCLSCIGQLGQGSPKVDLLKPSWTMDLGLDTGLQADRVSLSSYGSSGGEVNYDKPRNTLRRATIPTHAESPQNTAWIFPDQTHYADDAHVSCYGGSRQRPQHPYENYDFPRDCCTLPSVVWAQKAAMDRHSVASSLPVSEGTVDWYDTPRKSPQLLQELSSQRYADPFHNYDFPPAATVTDRGFSAEGVGVSVNGEGKMPLVVGSFSNRLPTNPIYAQVDKSKKTPKMQPLYVNTRQTSANNYVNLQFAHSLLIYENGRGVPPTEGTGVTIQSGIEQMEGPPLRRSASVPSKGRPNRDSASSEDSGVSGDAGLFSEDGSPLNDIGSLCLHESLPRRGMRSSDVQTMDSASVGILPPEEEVNYSEIPESPQVMATTCGARDSSPRHYETIPEKSMAKESLGRRSRSTSSGASDMSDYLETLSSSSRSSEGLLSKGPVQKDTKTHLKPRTGKEYFQIDRTLFANKD